MQVIMQNQLVVVCGTIILCRDLYGQILFCFADFQVLAILTWSTEKVLFMLALIYRLYVNQIN